MTKKFKLGRYYKHATGKTMKIVGEATLSDYWGNCLVGEDEEGKFTPIGRDIDHATGWKDITDHILNYSERGKE